MSQKSVTVRNDPVQRCFCHARIKTQTVTAASVKLHEASLAWREHSQQGRDGAARCNRAD
jgi:hypothetical protein